MNSLRFSAFPVVVLLLTSLPAHATTAGSVIFAKGAVTAEREPPVSLAKGDSVLVDDTIATGAAARAQLLMLDGAKISIRPNSRLKIEEYAYAKAGDADSQGSIVAVRDRSVTSLIKGGFRTLTGAIGKADETAYEVRTPVGVLGIRGTDYMAVLCLADCDRAPGILPNEPLEDGLYLGVMAGTIFFRNEFGAYDITAGGYAFVSMADRTLHQLSDPPDVFLEHFDLGVDENSPSRPPGEVVRTPLGFDGKLGVRREPAKPSLEDDGNETSDPGTGESPEQPVLGIDADGNPIDITPGDVPAKGNRTIGFSAGSLGGQDSRFASAQDNSPGEYQLDLSNNVIGFAGSFPSASTVEAGQYEIGASTLAESGFDSLTVLRWGRWSGGIVNITLGSGADASQDFSQQSLHWISGPENGVPVMPITGRADYSLVGGTSPTDNAGNVGVLGSASFFADFTKQVVTSDLTINMGASVWNAFGTGAMGAAANNALPPHLFTGTYSSVTVDGLAGGRGIFSGFFSEPGPSSRPDVPGGVGLTYSLQDESGAVEITGAAAFGNPQ